MMRLNRVAAEVMLACDAWSATDITGYGLLGHAQEMAEASATGIRFHAGRIPLLPGVLKLAERLCDPGVAMNESSFGPSVTWQENVPEPLRNLLWESQSSGGLLVALPPERTDEYCGRMADAGEQAWLVGEVIAGPAGTIEVIA
jgi:selenide,water dikinase